MGCISQNYPCELFGGGIVAHVHVVFNGPFIGPHDGNFNGGKNKQDAACLYLCKY